MEVYRAFLYHFLSLAFSYPEEEGLRALEKGLPDLNTSLKALGISYDPAPLKPIFKECRRRLLDLQGEYNTLFSTAPKAPSWETAYESDKTARRAAELSDIEGFYRAFGLQIAAPIEPDGLVAELEFLALLLQKKLHALKEGNQEAIEICEDAFRKFLTDHLGRWYGIFVLRLEGATEEVYYREIASLLKAFLDRETEGLGEIRRLSRYQEETLQESTWRCGFTPLRSPVPSGESRKPHGRLPAEGPAPPGKEREF